MSGTDLIAAERQRQIEKLGYDASHDNQYEQRPGTLTMAAICYATIAASAPEVRDMLRGQGKPMYFPWDEQHWKPGDDNSDAARIRELTKAGALIAAEIDRLTRRSSN